MTQPDETATMQLPTPVGPAPFVICGDNPMALRLAETLVTQYERNVIVVVRPDADRWSAAIRQLPGVEVVTAEMLDRTAFASARLRDAEALALVEQDDAGNVQAALLAQEINPSLRIVIRMAKQSLGEQISALLHNCVVLSASAIAAPAFVAAASGVTSTPLIEIGDRTVVGVLRERTRPDDVLAGLAVMGPRGTVPEVLPADADQRADLVLARSKPAAPPRPARPRVKDTSLVLSLIFGGRMRAVLAIFAGFYVIGAVMLALSGQAKWGDAAFSALITALSGNGPADTQNALWRAAIIVLTLVSIAIIPAVTTTIVDALVELRLRRDAGGLYEPISNHIVVVGLGDIGIRVVRALHQQGFDVVAVERNQQAAGVAIARDLDIPVIIGDGSRAETLDRASIKTAQALVVLSTDDVTNLETGLLGRTAKSDLRVVLRLFDSEFADRVHKAFSIHTSRSVSYLAAPAFAAAMIGNAIIATIPVRRRVLLVAEIPVGDRSDLEHKTVASINRPFESRLLAIRTGDQVIWRPSEGRPLRGNDTLVVVATRAGFSRLLTDAAPGTGADHETPFRLLQPWEIPHTRQAPSTGGGQAGAAPGLAATPPDQPGTNPPFGPPDGGWTGRA